MTDKKITIRDSEPVNIDDALAASISTDTRKRIPSILLTGHYGVRDVIKPELPANEILFNPLGVINRLKLELGTVQVLLDSKPGYYRVGSIGRMSTYYIFHGCKILTPKKTNTRRERRILRRAKKALNLKKVTKVLYSSLWPRVYCVEGISKIARVESEGTISETMERLFDKL
jgi:hypothetical protein